MAPMDKLQLRYILWSLLFCTLMLLNACSTYTKDGPPPFNVDVSRIPDATPKCEPPAKYGNMAYYRVHGRNYRVMQSAKNYQERGIASWYGMKFHKQRTSSGERYNCLAMTAAHKTLPLPTYVQVTNLSNGRKIIVKVNDRGPFAPNRIIDLSFVAAKKLGMLGRGTAYVDVRSIDPSEARQHPNLWAHNNRSNRPLFAANKTSKPPVYLQIGAFRNKTYAEHLKNKIESEVNSPVEITHTILARNNFYRVKVGPIHDLATEDTISKKLRAIGLDPKHSKV